MHIAKKTIIVLITAIFFIVTLSGAFALQTVYSETTNITGSAWGSTFYTGFNKNLCLDGYCEFNLQCYIPSSATSNAPKFYMDSTNSSHGNEDIYAEWDGSAFDFKEEPGYSNLLNNVPAGLQNFTFIANDTAGTYGMCNATACSSMDTDYTDNDNYTFSISWGQYGSDVWCDDFTVYSLTPPPVNYSLADHSDLEYNLTRQTNATVADSMVSFPGGPSGANYVRIGTVSQAPWTNFSDKPFTISAWARRADTVSNSAPGIFENSRFNSGCTNGYGFSCGGLLLRITPTSLQFQAIVDNATGYSAIPQSCLFTFTFTPGTTWHHYAITHNGTRGTNVTAYIDGVRYTNGTKGAGCGTAWDAGLNQWAQPDATAITGLGEDPNHSGTGLNGSLDDVRVWNMSLTPEEAYSVYLNETVEDSRLLAWYTFNESKMNASDYINPCSYDGSGAWNLTISCTITRNYTIPGPVRFNGTTTVFSANLITAKNIVFLSDVTIFQNGARMVTTG